MKNSSKAILILGVVLLIVVAVMFTMRGNQSGDGGVVQDASSDSGSATPTILIGSIHPVTGANSYKGYQMVATQRIAVKEINDAGGIKALGGAKLELAVYDYEGNIDTAATGAQSLIHQGVVVLTGTSSSPATRTVALEAERAGIPFVISVAAATDITDQGYQYTFRLQPDSDMFAADCMQYLGELKTDDMKTIAVIHEDSSFGTDAANYVVKTAPSLGLEVIGNIGYPATTADLSSEAIRLSQLNPDVLIMSGYYTDQALLIKEFIARDIRFPYMCGIANGAISDPSMVDDFGKEINGFMDVNFRQNPLSEVAKKLEANVQEELKQGVCAEAVYAYATIGVIADALERCGTTEPKALRDAIRASKFTNHPLPQHEILFNENGENYNAKGLMNQWQDGKLVSVYPTEFAESKYAPQNTVWGSLIKK